MPIYKAKVVCRDCDAGLTSMIGFVDPSFGTNMVASRAALIDQAKRYALDRHDPSHAIEVECEEMGAKRAVGLALAEPVLDALSYARTHLESSIQSMQTRADASNRKRLRLAIGYLALLEKLGREQRGT